MFLYHTSAACYIDAAGMHNMPFHHHWWTVDSCDGPVWRWILDQMFGSHSRPFILNPLLTAEFSKLSLPTNTDELQNHEQVL